MFSLLRIARIVTSKVNAAAGSPQADSQEYTQMSRTLAGLEIQSRMLLERATQEGQGNPLPTLVSTLSGPEESLKPIAAQLLGDLAAMMDREKTRDAVVQALVEALQSCLTGGMDRSALHIQASEALGKFRNPAAIPVLTEGLHARQATARRASAWALGEIGAPEAVSGLAEVTGDTDGDARDAIHTALRRIGTPEALAALEAWKNRPKG